MARRKTDKEHEADVARRHAQIARERAAELERNPTRDLPRLAQQMRAMREHLDGIPNDHEYEIAAVDALGECLYECRLLAGMIQILLDGLQGG